MRFDEQIKLEAYCRGYWLATLPGELSFGVTAKPGGRVVASFPTREGLERWLNDQPVMASQAFLLRRTKRR
jgi:hypothetical protein